MKRFTGTICLVIFTIFGATSVVADGLAGDWTGESICTVRPSPCRDEHVIYHVTEPDVHGDLKIRADKIVNGVHEDMGTLDCKYDRASSTITCSMKNGVWEFKVAGNTMSGTLKLPNGTVYRRVSLSKSKG